MSEESKGNNNVLRKSADNANDNNNTDIKEKRNGKSSLFIKVNMDGIAIGRKVDLSAQTSYETLAQTLEDMFKESTTVITCKGEFFFVFITHNKKNATPSLNCVMFLWSLRF